MFVDKVRLNLVGLEIFIKKNLKNYSLFVILIKRYLDISLLIILRVSLDYCL